MPFVDKSGNHHPARIQKIAAACEQHKSRPKMVYSDRHRFMTRFDYI